MLLTRAAVCPHCRGVVEEKENRARETMLIMGLQPWVLTAAWALTYAALLATVSLSVAVVCCASFLPSAAFSLLLVCLLLFSAAEISFGLMMASIFSRAKVAAIVGPLMHFAALMPRYIFFRTGAHCRLNIDRVSHRKCANSVFEQMMYRCSVLVLKVQWDVFHNKSMQGVGCHITQHC